jgi:predicted RNase H-like HicB family nuclease
MKIVVTKRSEDYHACLDGHPEIWGCGKTPNEAIGNLISAHTDTFKIEVEHK